tara:strand:- start:452 stop:1219 length:768 start_codon:yes stop_codon:yes gene_type:complete
MKKTFIIIISFLSLFLIQALFTILLFIFLEKKPENNNWGILITNISLVLVIYLTLKVLGIKCEFSFSFPKLKTSIYITLLAVCFIISYPFIAILNFMSDLSRNIIELSEFNFSIKTNYVFYYFNIIFITPILEELYYRKIILLQIEKKYNAFWAILISTILFSVYHMDYTQCQISFVFGLLSGYLYFKTKRIEISILLHSLINIFTIITSDSLLPLGSYYYLIPLYIIIVSIGCFLVTKIIHNVNKKQRINNRYN